MYACWGQAGSADLENEHELTLTGDTHFDSQTRCPLTDRLIGDVQKGRHVTNCGLCLLHNGIASGLQTRGKLFLPAREKAGRASPLPGTGWSLLLAACSCISTGFLVPPGIALIWRGSELPCSLSCIPSSFSVFARVLRLGFSAPD